MRQDYKKLKDSFKRLILLISESPYFLDEHLVVIESVCNKLDLDSSEVKDINLKIIDQEMIEADMVYLLGKYRDIYYDYECTYEEEMGCTHQDIAPVNDYGYKRQSKEIKAILDSDPKLAVMKRKYLGIKSLYENMENLFKLVIFRNSKLEHLSNNYRKELTVDNR